MINVTKINKVPFLLNHEHIEIIEFIPETKITLTNGRYYLVLEDEVNIINQIVEFKQKTSRNYLMEGDR